MEVIPGCKQTEVGVIPEDWGVYRLSELGDGTTPPIKAGPFGSALKKKEYVPTGFKIYGQEQVIRGDYLFGDYFISTEKYRQLESCSVNPGDVLLSLVGTVGKLLEIPEDAPKGVINPRLIRLSFDRSRVLSSYFRHTFESSAVQQELQNRAQGGTMGVLNAGILSSFEIALPGFEEQRAIATALSDMDALLDGLDRLIAKKRAIKQATMQQLLTGQTRLPGFGGGWEVKRLEDLGATYGGLVGKSKTDFGAGSAKYVPFINVIANIQIDCTAFDMVNVDTTENQNKIAKGDLLFNGSSETPEEVALCSFMAKEVKNLYLNSFCFGFRVKNSEMIDGLFLAYYIRSPIGRDLMKSLAQGSTRYNLSKRALLEAQLPLPEKEEQIAIATILTDMDAEITALETRRIKTRALKQAMMQELLTGRTRLV